VNALAERPDVPGWHSTSEEVQVLGDKPCFATIAVKNREEARSFYEGVLGLTDVGIESPDVIAYRSGSSVVIVYETGVAGSNQATYATWAVGDEIEDVVEGLRAKGVSFEHYDLPGTTRDGDIHVAGSMKTAWFRDPDGNILNLVNQSM
jgi:catechol 2,3-dioxygenase-like lactoylglutathione lyase family enzyme